MDRSALVAAGAGELGSRVHDASAGFEDSSFCDKEEKGDAGEVGLEQAEEDVEDDEDDSCPTSESLSDQFLLPLLSLPAIAVVVVDVAKLVEDRGDCLDSLRQ